MKMILTGDVNLMHVDDPTRAVRAGRRRIARGRCRLRQSRMLPLPPPAGMRSRTRGSSPIPRSPARRWSGAGIAAVGIANNVNYGEAAIAASMAQLDAHRPSPYRRRRRLAGRHAGRRSSQRTGRRFGFLQRSSVYWPTNHEAGDRSAGIAVIRGHTAYQVPMHKNPGPPMNRPGVPPRS